MITTTVTAWPLTLASRPLLLLAESGEQLLFTPAHHDALAVLRMVVVEQVQHTVDHEERELVVGAHPALRSLADRDAGADHDVSQQRRRVARLGRRARAATALIGLASRRRELVVDREGKHVGRTAGAEEALVELGDRRR